MSKCNNRVAFWENISYNSFISKVLDNLNKIRGSKAPAFTLTEVLLAVLIVGIIAALVLPAVVTKYQDKAFESAFNREVHSLQDSIDSLAAVENQQSFYETTLAKTPETYMKKYLRVSKYCGASGKDCFGKFYSEYSDHEKKTYTPSYDGNCAILKNGTSVCLNVNGGNIAMLIDVNGPKGPNVWGRDLRTYTHSVKGKTGYDMSSNGIISLNQTPIEDNDSDPCEGKTCGCGDLPDCDPCETDNNSYACCKKRDLTGSTDKCCQYEDFKYTNTCHPCPVSGAIYVPKIACVYVLPFYSPISKNDSAEMQRWDPEYFKVATNRLWGDNYWAGAKRACAKNNWILPDSDTLYEISKKNKVENLGIPLDNYWSSTQLEYKDNASGIFVDFSVAHDYGYLKDNSTVKALCLVD